MLQIWPYSSHLLHEDLRESSFHFLLYIHALGIVADLAIVADAAVDDPLGSTLKVGILADDGWGLAAQFEADLCDVLGCGGHDAFAGTY